ncbi:MAG: sulfite exporter TauE/SafE family protein [Tagaea sp.]
MEADTLAILFALGLLGGVVTALVGGSSLVTFPILVMVGIPPVPAVATNLVALTPANLAAAIADRGKLPPLSWALFWLLAGCTVAGGAGAALLLLTPARVFEAIGPALIGFATLLFAYSDALRRAIARARTGKSGGVAGIVLPSVLLSVYGGYFGAGMGVMYLALLALGGFEDMRTANALKNLLGVLNGFVPIVLFVASGVVLWPVAAAMLSGALIGGFGGGYAMRFIPPIAFRRVVVAIGAGMTAVYAWRYWF